jgi:hypothetical protein
MIGQMVRVVLMTLVAVTGNAVGCKGAADFVEILNSQKELADDKQECVPSATGVPRDRG